MPGTYTPDQPWRQWTRPQWASYRARVAALAESDPKWLPGPGLLRLADHHLERLEEK